MSHRSSAQASKTGDATKTIVSNPSKLDMVMESIIVVVLCLWAVYLEASKKNPDIFKQLAYGCLGIGILHQIVLSLLHRQQLLVEVSGLKAELQKLSSAVPQEKAQEPCKVQCFQVEEEPKSPQLLDSTKKVQSTKTKSVGMESVEVKVEGKGGLEPGGKIQCSGNLQEEQGNLGLLSAFDRLQAQKSCLWSEKVSNVLRRKSIFQGQGKRHTASL